MFILALTGSIGMGKSTVAKMFTDRGLGLWDADYRTHWYYGWVEADPEPTMWPYAVKPGLQAKLPFEWRHDLETSRGKFLDRLKRSVPEIFVDEKPNRDRLRTAVMQYPEILSTIEGLFSKYLRTDVRHYMAFAPKEGLLLDVPLLFEQGLNAFLKASPSTNEHNPNNVFRTVVVTCPPEIQRERVLARPGMTQERLDFVLARQMPSEEKCARADFIIDTSMSLDEVRNRVDNILVEMKLSAG